MVEGMDRPVRRSRQRVSATGLIGLLPQEEAAINRALHESLLEEKKKTPPKNKEPVSTRTMPEATSTDTQSHTTCSSTSVGAVCTTAVSPEVMELKAHDPVEGSSGTKIPLKRGRLHSPLSPSRSVDSSCESKSSSPTHICVFAGTSSSSVSSPLSVESSLKLVLSTSSWSCSSSSSWSPSPEPVSNNSEKMVQKSSKVQLLPKLKTETVSIVTKQKGKRGRPRKYPLKDTPPKLSKKSKGSDATSKAPKTHTKASASSKKKQHKIKTKLSKPKIWEPKHAAQQLSSELDVPPMSPEAAIVLHDHCYSSGVNISNTVEDDTATSTKCSIRSSPYPVQRKFAQNQVPIITPTRSSADVENVSGLKEVPKTEDFITFLCLRGSQTMPKELEKFAIPWTRFQRKKSKNGYDTGIRRR